MDLEILKFVGTVLLHIEERSNGAIVLYYIPSRSTSHITYKNGTFTIANCAIAKRGRGKKVKLASSLKPSAHAPKQVCCSTDDGQINLTFCLFASLPARSSSKFPIPCTCHSHIPSSRRRGKNHDIAEAVNTGLLLLDIPGDVATCPLCAIIE